MDNLIKEKRSWLRQLLYNPHIGILVTDMERKITFVNEHLCAKTGYIKEEILGLDSRIFHTSDASYEKFFKLVVKLAQEGKPVSIDYQSRHKNGHIMWVTISGNLLESKKEVLWTIIDITDRVEKEKEIKSLKERMEVALVGNNAGVWEWNLTTKRLFASPEWKKMLGYEDEELSNEITIWTQRVHPDDFKFVMEYLEESIQNREEKLENIHRLQHKEGHWIWILARATVIYEEDGTIRLVGIHTNITNQKNIEDELFNQKKRLEYLAHHDVLTNLPNRLLFNNKLRESLEKAQKEEKFLAVLFIDLDHFKEINDSFGHDTGDVVLQIVTKKLLDNLETTDTLARLGGDEFAIIVENINNETAVAQMTQKIINLFSEPILLDGYPFYISCSIGISLFPEDDEDASNLLKYADTAMYKAKDNGRNCYAFYQEEMTQHALQKVIIETELRTALQEEQLLIYLQPQFNAKEDKLVGMEALVRWEHPRAGFLTPDKFLSVAEISGLIVDIDRYIIKKAIKQLVQWYAKGFKPGVLAMNISVQQLSKNDFVSFIRSVLQEYKCKPEWIELEVTESGLMKNPANAIKILQELSDLGLELAVDDFGTGYSSLSYLKKLPINRLKIDKSFVDDLPEDEEDIAITRAVIALAKSLNLNVIAEGVETHAQKEFLVANGCEKIQGYLYAKPMAMEKLQEMLLK